MTVKGNMVGVHKQTFKHHVIYYNMFEIQKLCLTITSSLHIIEIIEIAILAHVFKVIMNIFHFHHVKLFPTKYV